jgi:ABC-2 type transport system ATP-binding protein
LIGVNGAGKTTLLRLILGEQQPDAGTIRQGSRLQIAYFDQMREQLNEDASLAETISPGSDWVEINGDRKHVMTYLGDFLFAPERARSPVKSLSGGERNRLLLARLFAKPANVLVLDEPTVGLDIESRNAIWQVLRILRDSGVTILLSSHYLEEVDALADRLAIVEAGRVIAEGTPEGLKRSLGGDRVTLRVREFSDAVEAAQVRDLLRDCKGVRQVVVNQSQGYSLNLVVEDEGVVAQIRENLAAAALPVFALALSRPSLDDVYLQATGRTLMDAELALVGQRDPKLERKQQMR